MVDGRYNNKQDGKVERKSQSRLHQLNKLLRDVNNKFNFYKLTEETIHIFSMNFLS